MRLISEPHPVVKPLHVILIDDAGDVVLDGMFSNIQEVSETARHYKTFHKINIKKVKITNTF